MPSRSRSAPSPRSTNISSPSASVGAIESPSTRISDKWSASAPNRRSQLLSKPIRPSARSPAPSAPAPAGAPDGGPPHPHQLAFLGVERLRAAEQAFLDAEISGEAP